jgi:membrane protein DedA with SNARE-associated domain
MNVLTNRADSELLRLRPADEPFCSAGVEFQFLFCEAEMEDLFFSFTNYVTGQGALFLYLFLFFSAIMENLFPPVPGDTVTALGAFLVGTGKLNMFLVFLSTTAGSVLGFFFLFIFARKFFSRRVMSRKPSWFPEESVRAAKHRLGKYGYLVILFNRFFPGIRSVISISAGLLQMKPLPVFVFSLISAAAWNIIWMAAGYGLGNNWDAVREKVGHLIGRYNIIAGGIICAIIVFFAARKIHSAAKRRKKR